MLIIKGCLQRNTDRIGPVPSFLGWSSAADCLGQPACCHSTLSPPSLTFAVRTVVVKHSEKCAIAARTGTHTNNSCFISHIIPLLPCQSHRCLLHNNSLNQPKLHSTWLNTMQRQCWIALCSLKWLITDGGKMTKNVLSSSPTVTKPQIMNYFPLLCSVLPNAATVQVLWKHPGGFHGSY